MSLALHLLRATAKPSVTNHFRAIQSQPYPALLGQNLAVKRNMSSVPKTMKAIIIEKTGDVDVLQFKTDRPVPEPQEGEVLIKNEFIVCYTFMWLLVT